MKRTCMFLGSELQSRTKYSAESKENTQNWTRPENSDICFCVSFDY